MFASIARYPIIALAATLHVVWGGALLYSSAATGATPVHGLSLLPVMGERHVLALFLIGASLLVLYGLARHKLWALIPQQFLLTFAAIAAVAAVIVGHYGDGVPRPHMFILADQLPIILVAVIHALRLLWIGRLEIQHETSA